MEAVISIVVRQAAPADAGLIHDMLLEVAAWLDEQLEPMWDEDEIPLARVERETTAGQFFIAEYDGAPAGAIRFQLDDEQFWPDIRRDDSAFIHRLVVRRQYAGRGVSQTLLQWAVERARALGKRSLRLDCDAHRMKLRALYERSGFRFHSFRQVGAYFVARYEYPLEPPARP